MSVKSIADLLARTKKQTAAYKSALKNDRVNAARYPAHPIFHIRIIPENAPAIRAALTCYENGQGKNHLHVGGVFRAAKQAQAALDVRKLPIALRIGTRFVTADEGAEANAYKYPIATTKGTIQRDGRGWLLVGLEAIRQWPRAPRVRRLVLTANAVAYVLAREKAQADAAATIKATDKAAKAQAAARERAEQKAEQKAAVKAAREQAKFERSVRMDKLAA